METKRTNLKVGNEIALLVNVTTPDARVPADQSLEELESLAKTAGGSEKCGQAVFATTDDPDYLLVPRAANKLVDRIRAVVRRAKRRGDEMSGVSLSEWTLPKEGRKGKTVCWNKAWAV